VTAPADKTPVGNTLLAGRRGWATVTTLALVLLLLVVGQLTPVVASASDPLPRAGVMSAAATTVPDAVDRPRPYGPRIPAVAVPAPAPVLARPAAATDPCSGEGWQSRRGAAALASLRPGADGSGFRVEFAPARSGYMGLTHLQRRVVEVFVRDCDRQSDELLRHVVAHELGHAFDTARLDAGTRAAWQAARGIPAATAWYGCSGCTDFATPAGDFAEVYAQWLRGADSNRSELAGAPGPAELERLAQQFFA
jgi:hypothetical protein